MPINSSKKVKNVENVIPRIKMYNLNIL